MLIRNDFFIMCVLSCTSSFAMAAATGQPAANLPAPKEFFFQGDKRNVSNRYLLGLGAAAIGSAAWWALSQHNHSKIGHERYPIMNRRNILRTLLAQDASKTDNRKELKEELDMREYELRLIQNRKTRFQVMRVLAIIAGVASTAAFVYGVRKKDVAGTATA